MFVLKVIIIRIFNDSFFVPEFSLVLRVSLSLGFKIKVNPYLCYQVLSDVITISNHFNGFVDNRHNCLLS